MATRLRRLHRLLGLLLAAPLILWMVTGLLFHIKHRYSEAYESLSVPIDAGGIPWSEATISPAQAMASLQFDPDSKLTLQIHPSGRPVYAGAKKGEGVLIDAGGGAALELASEETARRWVESAVDSSAHSSRFGRSGPARKSKSLSSWTRTENPAFVFEFSGDKKVTVDRLTGEISQTGALNDWIDLTYRVHYLQWTPWKSVNIALVLVAFPLVILLAISGLRLFFKKREPAG